MFEAKLTEGHILKKIVEAIKDLVTDVNIDVSASGKYRAFVRSSNLFTSFRPLSPSYGYLPCCSCLIELEHGGFRVIQMRHPSCPRYQHQQSLQGHEVG
jgi:hypothetical protein